MSTLLSTSLRRAGRDGAAFAEHLESHAADGTFDMLDTSATGFVAAADGGALGDRTRQPNKPSDSPPPPHLPSLPPFVPSALLLTAH